MTLDQVVAAPREITLAGRKFVVRPMTLRHWGEFQAWLKDHGRSPIGSLREDELTRFSDMVRDRIIAAAIEAQRFWPPAVFTTAWYQAVSSTEDGDPQLVYRILSRDNPEVTLAMCRDLVQELEPRDWHVLVRTAIGSEPDPKSSSPERDHPNTGELPIANGTTGQPSSAA